MSISRMLEAYLEGHRVDFALARHPHTGASIDAARAALVPGDRSATGVVVGRHI